MILEINVYGEKIMFITITGDLGSGKSTIAKRICEEYGFEYFSTGKIQREFAEKKGMSVLEFNKYLSLNTEIDNLIDNMVVEISRDNLGNKCIFDSRMAWHFVEKSFKIYMTAKPSEAAKRVMQNDRGNVEKYESLEDAEDNLIERKKVENERFKEIYNVDCADFKNFNLIVDSSFNTPDEIIKLIMDEFEIWQKNEYENKFFVSPKLLISTKDNYEFEENNGKVIVSVRDNEYYVVSGHKRIHDAGERKEYFVEIELERK